MAVLTNSSLVDVLLAVSTLLAIIYYYLTATFDYWAKRGVPYVKPTLFFGNLKDQVLMKKPLFMINQNIYNNLAGNKFGGYFESRTPVLMLWDPELIDRILIKDFSHFSDRDFGVTDLKNDPITGNLFNLKGQVWKNLRNKLTPTFTTGKLKGMLDQMNNCADELLKEMEQDGTKEGKKLGSTFSIDVIASCAFGLQFKADSPEGILFRKMVNDVFGPSIFRMLRVSCVVFFKPLAKILGLRQFPKPVSDYTINLVKSTMEFREKNNVERNDFLQLMMNLKAQEATGKEMNWKAELSEEDAYLNQMDYVKDDKHEKGLKVITDECIAAQSFVFLTGGSDSIASALSFALFEMASNPAVQRRLQEELDTVLQKYKGNLTYEALKEMTYLDLIIQENNRKYTLAQFIQRVCCIPYKIPNTDIVIEKGTRVTIPIHAIHNDPAIYPEPDKFIPERFEGNNYRTSGTYLPFGDGPRICIAMRFVLLELKVCLAKVFSRYSVTLDPRTQVPLTFDPTSFVLLPKGGIWLRFHKRVIS